MIRNFSVCIVGPWESTTVNVFIYFRELSVVFACAEEKNAHKCLLCMGVFKIVMLESEGGML